MLPALRLRPRASCLTWRPFEPRWLAQPSRHASDRRPRPPRWKQQAKPTWLGSKVETGETNNRKLLEELFPEEAERRINPIKPKREREVPRLQLDVPIPTPLPARSRQEEDVDLENRNARRLYKAMSNQERTKGVHTGVVILRNASNNLTDDDFRRLIPQGKHIEGWNLDRGDILKSTCKSLVSGIPAWQRPRN